MRNETVRIFWIHDPECLTVIAKLRTTATGRFAVGGWIKSQMAALGPIADGQLFSSAASNRTVNRLVPVRSVVEFLSVSPLNSLSKVRFDVDRSDVG